jgi:type VI protein secretion system component VasF
MDGGPDTSDAADGPGQPEPGAPAVSHTEKRFEIFATVLLAVAALATAWSGYQASLWDGIQSRLGEPRDARKLFRDGRKP